jgi:hypothetical protein
MMVRVIRLVRLKLLRVWDSFFVSGRGCSLTVREAVGSMERSTPSATMLA